MELVEEVDYSSHPETRLSGTGPSGRSDSLQANRSNHHFVSVVRIHLKERLYLLKLVEGGGFEPPKA